MCGNLLSPPSDLPGLSELIAPQLFKNQRAGISMEAKPNIQRPPVREDIIKELEQFSVEVLQAALLILQMRQSQQQKLENA